MPIRNSDWKWWQFCPIKVVRFSEKLRNYNSKTEKKVAREKCTWVFQTCPLFCLFSGMLVKFLHQLRRVFSLVSVGFSWRLVHLMKKHAWHILWEFPAGENWELLSLGLTLLLKIGMMRTSSCWNSRKSPFFLSQTFGILCLEYWK